MMRCHIVLVAAAFVLLSFSDAPGRTWTDATGQYTVEAELIEVVDGKVRLKKSDGRVLRVPVAKLSRADREYLASLRADVLSSPSNIPSTWRRARPSG